MLKSHKNNLIFFWYHHNKCLTRRLLSKRNLKLIENADGGESAGGDRVLDRNFQWCCKFWNWKFHKKYKILKTKEVWNILKLTTKLTLFQRGLLSENVIKLKVLCWKIKFKVVKKTRNLWKNLSSPQNSPHLKN